MNLQKIDKHFSHELFGNLTTITNENNEVFFIGKEVASILGYSNPNEAIRVHCKNPIFLPLKTSSTGRKEIDFNMRANSSIPDNQQVRIIPESDLYRLVMRSKLENAEKFQDWITEEVLPTIRKTGSYLTNQLSQIDILLLAVQSLKEQETKLQLINQRVENLEKTKEEAEKKLLQSEVSTKELPISTTRQKIESLVINYHKAKGIDYYVIWNMLYDHLYNSYRIKIKSHKKLHEKETWINVAERIGVLDELFVVASHKLKL